MLSKAGLCSRSEAAERIRAGRVQVDGHTIRDPEHPIAHDRHDIQVDGQTLAAAPRVYLMLNKPRGLVTTTRDERGRDTVYRCFEEACLPWIAPVGRLDKASEGLLLLSNDAAWAARITDPATGPDKTYHVQVDAIPDQACFEAMIAGVDAEGESLRAKSATLLRSGDRNAWLEITLDEGRNRQIRRLLAALGLDVLRLVRVSIGPLMLGALAKGEWRRLAPNEVAALALPAKPERPGTPHAS